MSQKLESTETKENLVNVDKTKVEKVKKSILAGGQFIFQCTLTNLTTTTNNEAYCMTNSENNINQ